MSAIFGLLYLDGRPLPEGVIERMSGRASAWGPDGVTTHETRGAALGHALLAVTPEDGFSAMPAIDAAARTIVTAAARLDNRDEVCDALGLSLGERAALADSAIVARAYRCWGDACPGRLFGDWAFAAWHEADRRLFLARDHLGATGLFYSYHPPLFAFASDAEVLFSVPGVPRRIDE